MKQRKPRIRIYKRLKSGQREGKLYCGEALEFLRSLERNSAQIVFLDPPFNLGKIYGRSRRSLDRRSDEDYTRWLSDILGECERVLSDGGALYIYHLPIWAMRFGAWLDKKLTFRQWIAISMKNGFVRGKRLYPAHYALLMFSKGAPKVQNRPKLKPALCRHCGKYIKDYGGYKDIIEAKGINLSDYWDDISPVRHVKKKNRTANELPSVVFDRVIAISGARGGVYVDPFMGAGGGVVAAIKGGMTFLGCDILASNCRLVARRMDDRPSPQKKDSMLKQEPS